MFTKVPCAHVCGHKTHKHTEKWEWGEKGQKERERDSDRKKEKKKAREMSKKTNFHIHQFFQIMASRENRPFVCNNNHSQVFVLI